ncbi:MAG: glycosyltransferase family 4 protein [Anaerolineales bacterium]|nr:glycosyltransferase family 4 protein [Anaerolineales bacterium]
MRILYLSQYFPPEVGATQTRAYEMAKGLVKAGHEVTVLTEVPNHPSGIIAEAFRGKLWVRRELDGIEVIHAWVKASPEKTLVTRMSFYLSYMFMATLTGLLAARGKFDVIYCTSPPLFAGGAGLALSYLRRTPLVFEVRDLWPESAVALGELNNQTAVRLSAWLARRCYARAQQIVGVTQGIMAGLRELGVPPSKLNFIPNGANTDLFQLRPDGACRVRQRFNLTGKFVAAYAGILGLAYSLETILYAAQQLEAEPDYQFLIIGAGPRERELRALLQELALTNVNFVGEVPYDELPDYLSAADVSLVPLRELSFFNGTLPVKMFDAWACETPTILTVNDGEAVAATAAAGAGLVIRPEDPAAMVAALREIATWSETRPEAGRQGREFVLAHYSRQRQAEQLAEILQGVIIRAI